MLHRIVGFLGVVMAFLSMSVLGLLSLFAPCTADTITKRLMEWAEND
jgi:thiol:disulfide interchange protein